MTLLIFHLSWLHITSPNSKQMYSHSVTAQKWSVVFCSRWKCFPEYVEHFLGLKTMMGKKWQWKQNEKCFLILMRYSMITQIWGFLCLLTSLCCCFPSVFRNLERFQYTSQLSTCFSCNTTLITNNMNYLSKFILGWFARTALEWQEWEHAAKNHRVDLNPGCC